MKRTAVLTFMVVMISLCLPAQENKQSVSISEGYGSITWGTLLSGARSSIRGKMVFTDEKSVIVTKDGELKYTYGFFYVDPGETEAEAAKEGESQQAPVKVDEGKLFYVILSFPYLNLQDVRKKYTEKYGAPNIENVEKNQGAVAWDDPKSIIVIWVDDYEGKPYTRRVSYVSKEIAKEVNDYSFRMFNKTELELIKALVP